ncbi:MAG: FKBP-type peptidyl-prolyl cis-trans isomerase [bacterium]|nr:FKBP-type peptidyl-prolyl cis-trans isomerase [Candidatus Sumerlaeota bacterium]
MHTNIITKTALAVLVAGALTRLCEAGNQTADATSALFMRATTATVAQAHRPERNTMTRADMTTAASASVGSTSDTAVTTNGAALTSGVVTLPSGTKCEEIAAGTGRAATKGSTVTVHYTGTLTNGREFGSSLRPSVRPFIIKLGSSKVIPGFEEGLIGMKVGGKRKLTIPQEQGYGKMGVPGVVPPKATVIFEVELLSVE